MAMAKINFNIKNQCQFQYKIQSSFEIFNVGHKKLNSVGMIYIVATDFNPLRNMG
jgi:hypothetical protein